MYLRGMGVSNGKFSRGGFSFLNGCSELDVIICEHGKVSLRAIFPH